MRILFFGNNWVGWQVLKWLVENGENILGLVLHPEHKRKYGDEMIECANLDPKNILDGSRLKNDEIIQSIRKKQPQICISAFFDYILSNEIINIFPSGCVNIHPSLLPYNRGQYPNVWSIIERTPAGVTIHYIDSGIDTGDIIAQKETAIEPVDTGGTLYRKLERDCLALFKETWMAIKEGKVNRLVQSKEAGTYHRTDDVDFIDEIDLRSKYYAGDLINIIRARTFDQYPGAYFIHEGKKIYMRIQLFYDDDLGENR